MMSRDIGNPRYAKHNPILNNIKKQFSGEMHRPDHTDFMTSSEFAATKRSGIRDNELGRQFEMWIVGECVFTVTYSEAIIDQDAWGKKSREYFGT